MTLIVCPLCGFEQLDPEPEWVDERDVEEIVCEHCEREFYEDAAAVP